MTLDFLLYLRDRHRDVGGPVTSGALFRLAGGSEQYWDHRLSDFTKATASADLTVLLHGFNVSCSGGREGLSRYLSLLRKEIAGGVALNVLWPGDGWAKALSYPAEAKDADDAAEALSLWLRRNAGAGARVSFVAHSLGCRVAMTAARSLVKNKTPGSPVVSRACLMAPAIDNDSLGRAGTACFREATLGSERIAVLASEQDEVLRFAYPLGDLAQMLLGRGHWGSALGRTGPRERASEVLARILPVPLSHPDAQVDHGDYLSIDSTATDHTVARTESFVTEFLAGKADPRWPVQR